MRIVAGNGKGGRRRFRSRTPLIFAWVSISSSACTSAGQHPLRAPGDAYFEFTLFLDRALPLESISSCSSTLFWLYRLYMTQPFLQIIPFSFHSHPSTPLPLPPSIVYYLHTSSFSLDHVPENGFPSTNRANALKFTANLRFPSLFPSELTTTPQPRALIRHEEANIDTPLVATYVAAHLYHTGPCFALQAHPPLFATPFNLAHSLSFRIFSADFPSTPPSVYQTTLEHFFSSTLLSLSRVFYLFVI